MVCVPFPFLCNCNLSSGKIQLETVQAEAAFPAVLGRLAFTHHLQSFQLSKLGSSEDEVNRKFVEKVLGK